MAEDFKHVEQTCLEILKMIDAISQAIGQLRPQQSPSAGNDHSAETFADCYSRKMLEDNEINMLKFLGRYLCEKEKLSSGKDYTMPNTIAGFPSFGKWLEIIGVSDLLDSSELHGLPMLSVPIEEALAPTGAELISQFCTLAKLKSEDSRFMLSRTLLKATENLRYYMNCLRSGVFCDSEKLSWSQVEPVSQPERRVSDSPQLTSRIQYTATKNSATAGQPVVLNNATAKNMSRKGDDSAVLMSKLGVTTSVVSPLQSSVSLRPRISAVTAPDSSAAVGTQSRRSAVQRESTPGSTNLSDAEEQLALRTWKDIDGVVRRYSNSHKAKSRGGLWAKFMTWSARRHLRNSSARHPERTPSLIRDRSGHAGPPRRLLSDPGKANDIKTASPSILTKKSQSSPTPACMIHVFAPHRVFVAKCDHCQRPMAFSCLICPLCKFRVHSSCANSLPQIALSSFKSGNSASKLQPSAVAAVTVSPKPPENKDTSPRQVDRIPNIRHADTIAEPEVSVIGTIDSDVELGNAMSAPTFPRTMDSQKENEFEYRDRKGSSDSTYSAGIFVVPRRNTENEKTMNVQIPPPVPEEDISSPISSPSYNNYSANYSAKTSNIDSVGSSGTSDIRYDSQVASPTQFLNGTATSTPASYGDRKQFSRRPARMSTFSEWSVTLREWLIPFAEVTTDPHPIARGRYTTVYRGIWHGDVAVKVFHGLDEEEGEGSKAAFFSSEQLTRTFRDEVSILPHTRHENLVLFLGASIDHEQLVIISNFCKGRTLDSLIYSNSNGGNGSRPGGGGGSMHHCLTSPQGGNIDQFSSHLTTADSILYTATQIAQAVAYLHNKGILHKDLRLRNIFIEANGRILLSDYGIFNATRLATNRHPDYLFVSRSWLFCLAPELASALTISPSTFALPDMGLPFTEQSDVFSFGCVWFELLHRLPPVENSREDCHLLLYERGHARLPELKSPPVVIGLPAENAHELLQACWSKKASDRPRFADIIEALAQISPLLATAAAAGIAGGGLASANSHNRNRSHLGASHRFAHHPVRSPSQPLRGGSSRGTRALPFVMEPLTVEDSRK